MEKTYIIGSVRESEKSVSVEVITPSGEVKKLRMTTAMWSGFDIPSGDVIPRDTYLALKALAEKCEAVTRAIRVIADAPHSYASLHRKLTEKGFSKEAVDAAIAIVKRRGLIDEAAQAEIIAERMVRTKHRGPARVATDLCVKGYPKSVAQAAADSVDYEAYREALRINLERKCHGTAPTDKKEREKLTLSLVRLGFSTSEIIRALEEI